jgi:hypothetical protein
MTKRFSSPATENDRKRVRRFSDIDNMCANEDHNDDNGIKAPSERRGRVTWGEWMGAHKTGDDVDHESERIDRQRAAFGGDTIARLKDLNVLIVGCAGVGVETAKNLILSNVGGVVLWDDTPCEEVHRGSNFYVTALHVEGGDVTLAEASLAELRSLVSTDVPFLRSNFWLEIGIFGVNYTIVSPGI